VIFEQRLELMDKESVGDTIVEMRHDVVGDLVAKAIPPRTYPEQWDADGLTKAAKTRLNVDAPVAEWAAEEGIDEEAVRERLAKLADESAEKRAAAYPPGIMQQVEKSVLLQTLDMLWREHLVMLDHLSKVIHWRGVAQRDPLNEYKQEAYQLFEGLLQQLRDAVITQMSHVQIQMRAPQPPQAPDLTKLEEHHTDPLTGGDDALPPPPPAAPRRATGMVGLGGPSLAAVSDARERAGMRRPAPASSIRRYQPNGNGAAAASAATNGAATAEIDPKDPSTWGKVGRNSPCPCGSGKKYKHCHGAY